MITPKKGDTVILHNGDQGVVISGIFKMTSLFDRDAVAVSFKGLEMPIDLTWIGEIWRDGARIEPETIQQLSLWG